MTDSGLAIMKIPGPICCICLDSGWSQQRTTSLACNHVFHTSCISDWVFRNNSCPLCRRKDACTWKFFTYPILQNLLVLLLIIYVSNVPVRTVLLASGLGTALACYQPRSPPYPHMPHGLYCTTPFSTQRDRAIY